ncbi:uncharacterized protein LOC119168324 isoform X2 [Rhipicephalus microplus]|uniref:uncharacterized protein LOC119168324 isoform X2 n=1 Tax=Rhipicephalus microplus TaxID=6941 RepID=UPI003F6D8812
MASCSALSTGSDVPSQLESSLVQRLFSSSSRYVKVSGPLIDTATMNAEKPHRGHRHHCNLCDCEADYSSCLKRHVGVHTGERPCECPSCPRSFSRKDALNNHIRTHKGKRPYRCPLCPLKIFQYSSLKRHVHTYMIEQPHKCHLCPRSFSQKCYLNIHLFVHIFLCKNAHRVAASSPESSFSRGICAPIRASRRKSAHQAPSDMRNVKTTKDTCEM